MLLCLTAALPLPAAGQDAAIVHGRVWTMTSDRPLDNATIVVRGGKIVSVAAGGPAPGDLHAIDARGHDVTPALFGAATQLGLAGVSAASDTDDRSAASGPLAAAFDIRFALDPNDLAIELARASGMARAAVVPSGSPGAPFDGQAAIVSLAGSDAMLERGDAAVAVTIDGDARGTGSRGVGWGVLRNALDEAIRAKSLPADNRPRGQLLNHVDLAALAPVVAGRAPLLIRTNRESDLRQAIALARDYRLKVIVAGATEGWRVARELAAAGIPAIVDPLADLPMSYDETGARPENAAILDAAGVRVAFAVSAQGIYLAYSPAASMREGAGIAVAHGLGEAGALRAITANPAAIWGMAGQTGAIAPGQRADIVIWDGDPIEPGTAPLAVLLSGKEVSLETRQTRLRDRYRPVVSQ